MSAEDDAVRATNDDAASCKRSAVQMNYWQDPYIHYFIKAGERKAPEINRGYYARVKGIQVLLRQFIQETNGKCQIINLGAGFDTTYWNLKDEGLTPHRFIEMDFQGVVNRKAYYIKNRQPLLDKLSSEDAEVQIVGCDLHSAQYHVVSTDLRDLSQISSKLKDSGVDYTLPTAFIAECVLVYMPSESSTNLLRWIVENFQSAFFINYEQVNMGDRFGQVMIENLKSRGCILAGVEHCRSLDSQKQRFLSVGWQHAEAKSMLDIYRCLPQAEIQRIEKLEFLDEREMLDQLFEHYCIAWAGTRQEFLPIAF
jgi:[phosphatase 2A protein]-leucine-carboxy methyltransferase